MAYKKMVVVKWVDSTNHMFGWNYFRDEEVAEQVQLKPILTCGFLVYEDDDRLVISHSDGGDGSHYDLFAIPRGCVQELKYLTTKRGAGADKKSPKSKA